MARSIHPFSTFSTVLSIIKIIGLIVKFATDNWHQRCKCICLFLLILYFCTLQRQSKNNSEFDMWNLTSSLSYELQIRCVPNEDCAQCPLSEVIMVPQGELRTGVSKVAKYKCVYLLISILFNSEVCNFCLETDPFTNTCSIQTQILHCLIKKVEPH